jgi:hypothetical protein
LKSGKKFLYPMKSYESRRSVTAEELAAMSKGEIVRLQQEFPRLISPAISGNSGWVSWTYAEERLLGIWPDESVAQFFGRTLIAVKAHRRRLGRRRKPPGKAWTVEEDRLLDPAKARRPIAKWTAELAARLGRTVVAVSIRRTKVYGAMLNRRWTRREIRMLGRLPDREVAVATGRHYDAVAVKRGAMGIPSYRARSAILNKGEHRAAKKTTK